MVATLRDNSYFCKGVHPAVLSALVDPVLATYKTLVATPADDEDTILGFIVFQGPETCAFIYVRSQFRSKPRCEVTDVTGVRCGLAIGHEEPHEFNGAKEPNKSRVGGGVARALLVRAGTARAIRGNRNVPEISCAFMVHKLEGMKGQVFASLAESKGYRLRFRPYLPLEATARVIYGDAGK